MASYELTEPAPTLGAPMATRKRTRRMTPDRAIDRWEQQKADLRAAAEEIGVDAVGEKQPDGGEGTEADPFIWYAPDSTVEVACFYPLRGELMLMGPPRTHPKLARAYAALRSEKEKLH
jgi:hypothetical protein